MIERVAQSVADEYEALAASVRQDLWLAGLPVVDSDGHSGANVYVDPFRIGDSEGVFVEWRISSELMDVFKGCVTRGELDHPAIPFGGAVLDTMKEALQGVLEGAGWHVDAQRVGVHESSIKVVGRAISDA
ncbi:hypothetical protein [Streptomyces spiramyceticus]|uniref:hypothetical protein n=1 Tax=Streptomyces spiramyceticus TaxID=299717 RepID=UPI00237B15D2|nr:hypothetical protein [Streptomyces spiramyceticus]